MTPEEVASRFDNRPGYSIVDYGLVGLPVFKVTAIGLTLLKKDLDPIEEFVLRAIRAGLFEIPDIAGLLGLSQRVVDAVITEMISRENIRVTDGQPLKVVLTEKGNRVALEQQEIKPAEQTLPFTYDGFLRQPQWFNEFELYAPKELKERAIPELRAYPDRGPELHELDVQRVADVLSLAAGRPTQPVTLLRITSVEKRVRLFREAVALAYRSNDSDGVQIAFAIDGRLSELHERAFALFKGLERNSLFRGLTRRGSIAGISEELDADLLKSISSPQVEQGRIAVAKARARLVAAKIEVEKSLDTDAESIAKEAFQSAARALKTTLETNGLESVRPIEVYEHADLLNDALVSAQQRLLIVSPWIRASVVDRAFLGKLESLIQRGVHVAIGYGLGIRDEDERPADLRARESLHELADRYAHCIVQRLGDTHAKVLIKDREFFVISSFNWLSFRGDRSRKFREELGTFVGIAERVDGLHARMMLRFTEADAASHAKEPGR